MTGASDRLKVTYAGGGSQFVATFLHGLTSVAEDLKALGRPIELSLLDPDLEKAGLNARYADLVARRTGLPIKAQATDDRDAALPGSDWVMFGIGLHGQRRELLDRYGPRLLDGGETGVFVALEAAVYWPWARRFGEDMARLCPDALFCTLANPTDVLAPAVATACSIESVGLCVEVPQLQHWLAHYLRVPYGDIRLGHLGLNHLGWVSRWEAGGESDVPKLAAALRRHMGEPTWQPRTDWFVDVLEATGYMRTGPYHPWPFVRRESRADAERAETARQALKADCATRWMSVEAALERGEMIPECDPCEVHPCAPPYLYPSVRHTFGAIAVGLAGGSAGPVPIQARNGEANASMPADAWLEAPTRVEDGRIVPQAVPPLPEPMTAELRALAHQLMLLAEWLAADSDEALRRALMLWPNVASVDVLLELCDELARCAARPV